MRFPQSNLQMTISKCLIQNHLQRVLNKPMGKEDSLRMLAEQSTDHARKAKF